MGNYFHEDMILMPFRREDEHNPEEKDENEKFQEGKKKPQGKRRKRRGGSKKIRMTENGRVRLT